MMRLRGPTGLCLGLVALLALAAVEARAGSLTLVVTVQDGAMLTIAGGPNGAYSTDGNTLTVTAAGIVNVNTFLASNGIAVQFGGLQASSDFSPNAGVASGSFVTQTGSIFYNTALAGTGFASVQAFQMGFQLPSGTTGSMQSSATANFTQAPAGSGQTFTSIYNSSLSALPLTSTSTGTAQNNYSPSNLTGIPTFVTPFEISNLMSFSLLANANAPSTDGFTGSTTILANAVPEPSSLSLVLAGGIPFAVYQWVRRRRMVTS